MVKLILLTIGVQILFPPLTTAAELEVEGIEGDTINIKTLNNGSRRLRTSLAEIKHLGILEANNVTPHLLLIAKPCENCAHEKSIFMVRTDNGKTAGSFVYPGKVLDPKTRQVVLESRAFFGKCLTSNEDVYIVFQREKVDRRHAMQPSVLVVRPGKDHIEEQLIERRLPQIRPTLRRVKANACQEIEGRNRYILSKALDLTPRKGNENDADEEEEEEQPLAADIKQ